MSRLEDAEVTVYRTDELGTILAVSDGKNITFSWAKKDAAPDIPDSSNPPAETKPEQLHIGNVSSKIFHLPSCTSLPSEKNQIHVESYDEAIAAGYRPCTRCLQ